MIMTVLMHMKQRYASIASLSRRRNRKNQGIAVILALTTMLMVVSVALELHLNERNNMIGAAVLRDRVTLQQMAASGVHLAMAVLLKDRQEVESVSLQEDWADTETMAAIVETFPFEEGKLEVAIVDEMSKIQINALVKYPDGQQFNDSHRLLWERFAQLAMAMNEDLQHDDMLTLIHALKDWLDGDDHITELSGAESDYYQGLDPPYSAKNGPLDHLSELLLVKGVTPEIYHGVAGVGGLSQYLTVYGAEEIGDEQFTFPGKININTAELPVLSALLPFEYAEFAPLLIEHREATSGSLYTNELTRQDWYKMVPGMAGATIDPNLLTVSSDTFQIISSAVLNDVRVTTTAVVQRTKPSEMDPWQCKILKWETE
ncbi:MAG: type II secretion system minor pseudopilin GspK [Desulfatitalea sp.]|nr:type II secretion system minor pseudopilin GspK [Desulfatitalea sp.]